jgi:hypothetical protein
MRCAIRREIDERLDKAKESNEVSQYPQRRPIDPLPERFRSVAPLVKAILVISRKTFATTLIRNTAAGRKVLYEIIEDEERSPGLPILRGAID